MGVQNMSPAELYHLIVIFPLIISSLDKKVVGALKTFLRLVGFIAVMQCSFHGPPQTLLFVKIKTPKCNITIVFLSQIQQNCSVP